ncbi:hypothetical protein J4457_02650 [Candidatus Woesearchaeota archaeon]|nr:hypothetical protein [Candidatus Woesearchaeota archaeon]
MPEQSALLDIVQFFNRLGVYDVILPFLLVFTLMFAILEKTKVLGTENGITKKNLNAMVAFVVGFFVIASARLVEIISTVSSQVVVLLLLAVLFLMLVGSFMKEGEGSALDTPWNVIFMVIMFVGIIFIFLNAIKNDSGKTWLQIFWDWLGLYWRSSAVASLIFVVFVVIFIYWITKSPGGGHKEHSTEKQEKH